MSAGSRPTISVFGGIAVYDRGEPVSIGGPRQRRLLALLALRPGASASIDWLAEHLWSDPDRPDEPIPAIRTYMSRLRQALPTEAQNWLRTESGAYVFDPPPEALEHVQFVDLRATAATERSSGEPLDALRHLDRALALWRGAPFPELEDTAVARATIEQLERDRLEMLEERWECALALGRHTQITGELAAFTSEYRLRDRATRQYALALYRGRQTADALRAIADHREFLAEQSGLDPSPELVELEQAILRGDTSLDVDSAGRPLRGYRLLDEIGSGAFSVVWRGMQPSVGREVAIKQIRSELATQPEFIRRFEAEAHLVARLEHPHVVPVIDYWRDPDSAYLVMRWLRGGTLERRIDEGPLSVQDTLLIARHVGGALAAAHARGIVHRDVKSANVLFDEQGNAYLGDFGIALEAAKSSGSEAAASPGSPAYAAPEQIRREPLGPPADVFSLAVVLYECLSGSLPHRSASIDELVQLQLHTPFPRLSDVRSGVPEPIDGAIARATSKDPSDRFDSVQAFLDALHDDAPETTPAATMPADVANPYKGLLAFDDGDEKQFFGRDAFVGEVLSRLSGESVASRAAVVVGPSGSGKSSVVRAGLLPALRAGGVDGSDGWFVTTMVPGSDAYESLEAALLRVAVNPPASLLDQLRDGERGILRSVRRCLPADGDTLLLVVDQFEELFTSGRPEDARDFLSGLAVAVRDPQARIRVVVTLRADYYHHPLSHPTFAPVVKETALELTPLAPHELEEAIVAPAVQAGARFAPGLVARIAAETMGQPSPLPLLQYALRELFDRRSGAELTLDAYEKVGGFSGALARRAEAIHAACAPDEQQAIRRVFGQLTNPTDEAADIRRRVPVADLGNDAATAWAIGQYGDARLLTFDRDRTTREPIVEVAHEALLREWPRLNGWLEEDADLLRTTNSVAVAANNWEHGGFAESDLLRAGRLEAALGVATIAPDRLRTIDQEFIEASQNHAVAEREREAGRVRRLRRLVGATAAALVLAVLAAGIAFVQRDQARDATEEAELATMLSTSAAQTGENPELALLLALEANRRAPGTTTEHAVLRAVAGTPIPNRLSSHGIELAEGQECLVLLASTDGSQDLGVVDGVLTSRDSVTGEIETHGPSPSPCVTWDIEPTTGYRMAADVTSARTTIWAGNPDDEWNIERSFDGLRIKESGFIGTSRMVFGTPLGETQSPGMYLIDLSTGEDLAGPIALGPGFHGADGSRDGSYAVMAFATEQGAGLTAIFDGVTGEELFILETEVPLSAFAFDLVAQELVGARLDGLLTTIDLRTGAVVATVATEASTFIQDVGIRSDGLVQVVSAGQAETVDRRLGPVGDIVELFDVEQAIVRSDGLIVTATTDRRVEVLDLDGTALVQEAYEIDPFAYVTMNDGLVGATHWPHGDAVTVDLSTGASRTVSLIEPDGTRFVPRAVFPDDGGLWATDIAGRVTRWEDGAMVSVLDLGGRSIDVFRYENWLATMTGFPDGTGQAHLVELDVERGPRLAFSVPITGAVILHPTRDGGMHLLDDADVLRTYDSQGNEVAEIETNLPDGSLLDVDPATGRVAVGSKESGAVVIDVEAGDVTVVPMRADVNRVGFAGDGTFLVFTSSDGNIRLWDTRTDEAPTLVYEGRGSVRGGSLWYDESTESVWVVSTGRLLRVPLEPERWIERACEIVGRDLTQDEWDRHVPGDLPLQGAC